MSLLDRISELRKANGNISINRLEKEAGLTRGSMSKWDEHKPGTDKIKKVADFFCVSVDYLLTGSQQKEKPTPEGELDVSASDIRLLRWFRSLPPEKKKAILLLGEAPEDILG